MGRPGNIDIARRHKGRGENLMILNIYGTSSSGKTEKVVGVIKRLREANIRVASIKHTKGEYTMDTKGKDTFRHQEAGASLTVFATARETDFIIKEVLDLATVLRMIDQLDIADVVVIEGYKELALEGQTMMKRLKPDEVDLESIVDEMTNSIKIERALKNLPGLNCGKCGKDCIGLATEGVEQGQDEIVCPFKGDKDLVVLVNGKPVFLNNFSSRITKNTILGLVTSFKQIGDIEDLKIELNVRKGP